MIEWDWRLLRPDAMVVWKDPYVREALSWYWSVMTDRKPAKFMIAKRMDAGEDPRNLDEDSLWDLHDELAGEFTSLWTRIREDEEELGELSKPEHSFLDVKVELAYRLSSPCRLCERMCRTERRRGTPGVCLQPYSEAVVHSYFHHMGEEGPLVPSGTIFYGGCNFRCVFCQNYDISQLAPLAGERISPSRLAAIQRWLRETGARNINHVGGEPTPSLPVILDSFRYLDVNVPQLWNSNFYASWEALKLLLDVIDIWLPDFKYGNDRCALRLSRAPRYIEVITRNLKEAARNGDMIIRHLILPGHLDCCTRPVLRWIAGNLSKGRVLVNIMEQYRPEHLVTRRPDKWPEIDRRPRRSEVEEAYGEAEKLGLIYKQVS